MYWGELLAKLDSVRSKIRQVPNFSRTLIPAEHEILSTLADIASSASVVEEKRVMTLEIGADGKPIIPAELKDIFAIAPAEDSPEGPSSSQRIDTKTDVTRKPPKGNEPRTSMLPREDKHINHPPVLTEADEQSVEK